MRLLRAAVFLAGKVSVRVKIMGIVVGLILVLGGGVTLQVRASQEATLGDELAKRGLSIARDVATRGTDYVLTNNSFALHQLVRDTLEDNEDVRYVFVLDNEGRVLAHTFARGLPRGLAEANSVGAGSRYRIEVMQTEEGLVRDIAVPILDGRAGTARVGMSDVRLRSLLAVTTQQLLLTTGLASVLGLCLAYLLTVFLTQPIQELVEVAKAVTAGDLGRRARVWAEDEIGHLSRAFNAMTTHLTLSNQEILQRNRELAALNAVANAIARPFGREEVLSASLQKVLEVMDLRAGMILLHDRSTKNLVLAAAGGAAPGLGDVSSCPMSAGCLCWEVFFSGEARVIDDITNACPQLSRFAELTGGVGAGVPLISQDICHGVLYVVGAEHSLFGHEQVSILRSIGRQIGVAVEKAMLWEELRQREALRSHLLERVIAAQEEERRRIAREIHDDMAQGLAALMMSLEAAEREIPPEYTAVREQLSRTRDLTSRSLAEARRLIVDLRPLALDSLGLIPAIRWYAEHRLEPLGIEVDIEARGLASRLAPLVETTVFRIVQEAINNIAKHSGASSARVEVELRDGGVNIMVADNGRGFEPDRFLTVGLNDTGGVGLLGMRERAALLGGTVLIESSPGEGTRVLANVPLHEGGAA